MRGIFDKAKMKVANRLRFCTFGGFGDFGDSHALVGRERPVFLRFRCPVILLLIWNQVSGNPPNSPKSTPPPETGVHKSDIMLVSLLPESEGTGKWEPRVRQLLPGHKAFVQQGGTLPLGSATLSP
jgi:hypothetical protein